MTTTVYDKTKKLLTSDSRWSYNEDFGVLYVDDIGFDKIEKAIGQHAEGYVFLFAGNSGVIQLWKTFIRSSPKPGTPIPTCQGIAILAVHAESGDVVLDYGPGIRLPNQVQPTIRFAGTGSVHAAQCWHNNGCARKAVDSAKGLDPFSGGEVKFFELVSGNHNLNAQIDLSEMSQAFNEKGMVMFKDSSQKAIPVQDASANDARVKEFCEKIANGQITLNAPCEAMLNLPTAEDEERVQQAMTRIFG